MLEHEVPGMAVAVIDQGRIEFICAGVASQGDEEPVTPETLFEIGSVTKTFTALMGAYQVERGAFTLESPASSLAPELAGSAFDHITMLQLATYTPGGLPLQFPDGVASEQDALKYFQSWSPSAEPGSQRVYSNPSIALFGYLVARSFGSDFDAMMSDQFFPAFDLRQTFLRVPDSMLPRYAWGVSDENQPARVRPGALGSEAYGIRASASDLAKYVQALMQPQRDPTWTRAIAQTRVPRYSVGPMTQGLGWEMYAFPVPVDDLVGGNSREIALKPNDVEPPRQLHGAILYNKTGSTNGFCAYVAYVPDLQVGVVVLANRAFPSEPRVRVAHAILTELTAGRR